MIFETQMSVHKVQERIVSTLEHLKVPKWDRTRCLEDLASSVGMPHPLQMFYGNLSQLGIKPISVIRSRSGTGSKIGAISYQWRLSLYMVILQNAMLHSGEGDLILFDKIPGMTI